MHREKAANRVDTAILQVSHCFGSLPLPAPGQTQNKTFRRNLLTGLPATLLLAFRGLGWALPPPSNSLLGVLLKAIYNHIIYIYIYYPAVTEGGQYPMFRGLARGRQPSGDLGNSSSVDQTEISTRTM